MYKIHKVKQHNNTYISYYAVSHDMTEESFEMDAKSESLESSIPVPSVQELALQRRQRVPPRYIRDDDTSPSDPSLRVPLIDMAKLFNKDTQQDQLQKLHLACKHWGVFQVPLTCIYY